MTSFETLVARIRTGYVRAGNLGYLIRDPDKDRRRAVDAAIALRSIRAFEGRFPELRDLGFDVTQENAKDVLECYESLLPVLEPSSRGSYLRSKLHVLRERCPELATAVELAIARSDLEDGLPDRASPLRHQPDMAFELEREERRLEEAYGADLISGGWEGASRAASLRFYFETHRSLVEGRDVLHIAPESDFQTWVRTCCRYTSLDAVPGRHVDVCADIRALPFSAATFDVVLCHRVMEHVMDDKAAYMEFARVLRSGGLLNLSVPQAAHRRQTTEWLYPDLSHHRHVRHYGLDLEERIASAGFSQVSVEPWLLARTREELKDRNAYPMRMYNAWKQ
jgi:hypothetical protein